MFIDRHRISRTPLGVRCYFERGLLRYVQLIDSGQRRLKLQFEKGDE